MGLGFLCGWRCARPGAILPPPREQEAGWEVEQLTLHPAQHVGMLNSGVGATQYCIVNMLFNCSVFFPWSFLKGEWVWRTQAAEVELLAARSGPSRLEACSLQGSVPWKCWDSRFWGSAHWGPQGPGTSGCPAQWFCWHKSCGWSPRGPGWRLCVKTRCCQVPQPEASGGGLGASWSWHCGGLWCLPCLGPAAPALQSWAGLAGTALGDQTASRSWGRPKSHSCPLPS